MNLALKFAVSAMGQVSVKSYTRSDGTVVAAYTRRSPSRTGGDTKLYNPYSVDSSHDAASKVSRKAEKVDARNCVLVYGSYIVCGGQLVSQYSASHAVVARDSRGRILRSASAKKTFQSLKPCPATHSTGGKCPGYVVDHITPLACGGADDASNMQWQTVADGKAKDKWERKQCGKRD
jgi:hypothetical protein